MNKRIFLAVRVKPEPELLDLVDLLRDELAGEQIKWVDEEQLHITLRFFGDSSEDQVKVISAAVKSCCRQHRDFSFDLCNPGYFHKRQQPTVVFLRLEKADALMALQKDLEDQMEHQGISREERKFKPHLTLGRIKSIRDSEAFDGLLKQFPQKCIQQIPVTEVILYESILKPSGPEYHMLERFKLENR